MSKWMHTLLFKNTLDFMDEVKSYPVLANYINQNCYESISCKIRVLRERILEHRGPNTSIEFLEKWELLPTEKEAHWVETRIDALDQILKVFEDSPEIVVAESFINELDKKKDELLQFRTRFTENAIKKMSENSKVDKFRAPLPNIFIRYAMIPYFSLETNAAQLERYLMWIRKPANLLKTSDKEKAAPKYQPYEIAAVAGLVDGYIEEHNFSFNEASFYDLMKALFVRLRLLSEFQKSKNQAMDDQKIYEDIKKTYLHKIFPNSGCFVGTVGVAEEELNNLIDDAIDDTLTAYHTYCKRFKDNQKPSWDECISYGGFYVEMMYFLYSRLWQCDSFYLKEIALSIRNEGWHLKTFINEEAIIAPTVFIKENCIIEKAEIQGNVYLANCRIDNGAIIEEGVTIDPTPVVIGKDTRIKSGTVIKGHYYK